MTTAEGNAGEAFKAKAKRTATKLMDDWPDVAETHEGVHALVMLAYMMGVQDGSTEAIALMSDELRKAL